MTERNKECNNRTVDYANIYKLNILMDRQAHHIAQTKADSGRCGTCDHVGLSLPIRDNNVKYKFIHVLPRRIQRRCFPSIDAECVIALHGCIRSSGNMNHQGPKTSLRKTAHKARHPTKVTRTKTSGLRGQQGIAGIAEHVDPSATVRLHITTQEYHPMYCDDAQDVDVFQASTSCASSQDMGVCSISLSPICSLTLPRAL